MKNDLLGKNSGRRDLNPRSPAPEAGAIPSFATARAALIVFSTDDGNSSIPNEALYQAEPQPAM